MSETAKEPITKIELVPAKDYVPIQLELIRLDDLPKGDGETFLNYGSAGCGKTFFAGTAGSRTLIINNGGGMNTLLSPLFQSKYKGCNPIIVTVAEKMSERGVFNTAEVFDEICDSIDYYLKNHHEDFDTVVIDDVTQLRRGAMNKALELNDESGKSNTLKNFVKKFDLVSPAVQDYGVEMNLIEQFIASYTTTLKEAGKHFILNAHERQTFGKPAKIGDVPPLLETRPGFTGQTFPDQVTMYFDNVWHFEVVSGGSNRVYRVTTQGHETLVAKTRWGGVFETIETNPNFPDVIRRIRETTPETMKRKK